MLRMRVFESQSLLAAVQTAIRPVSFIGQDMAAALAGASSDTRAIDNLAAQVTARSGRRAACLGVLLARGAGASADCRAHSGAGRDGVGRAGDIVGARHARDPLCASSRQRPAASARRSVLRPHFDARRLQIVGACAPPLNRAALRPRQSRCAGWRSPFVVSVLWTQRASIAP